jgi:hypothetical protein
MLTFFVPIALQIIFGLFHCIRAQFALRWNGGGSGGGGGKTNIQC